MMKINIASERSRVTACSYLWMVNNNVTIEAETVCLSEFLRFYFN